MASVRPGILSTVRDLERLRQIVGVLARHGFGELIGRTRFAGLLAGAQEERVTRPFAERIRNVLEELGPSFVKLGQVFSTRPDLIPEDIALELKKLQDQVPPLPSSVVREIIEGELSAKVDDLFLEFDDVPLASASIGQVHRAKIIHDGQRMEVVVKVQRAGIDTMIERDVELLYLLAHAIERNSPDSKIYQPVKLVSEFDRAIHAELDFTLEADHAIRFAKNFEAHADARFPKIYRQLSSRRVLTMEFFDGQKVYDAVKAGWDANIITRTTLRVLIKSVFEDGFFHADPHPGNVILMGTREAPVLGMVDLGLVGRLTPQLRDKTIDLMVAAAREDYRAMADALYAIGTPTIKVDRNAFEADVTSLSQKYLGKQLGDIVVSALIRDLVGGATKHRLEIPPDFLLVGKAIMTLEGIGRELSPGFDLFSEMKPYFLDLFASRFAPERVAHELMRNASRISAATTDLPMQLQEILDDLRRGRLEMRVRDPDLGRVYDLLGRRVFSGLCVASLTWASAYLMAHGRLFEALIFLVAGLLWGSSHLIVAWWLGRKSRNL